MNQAGALACASRRSGRAGSAPGRRRAADPAASAGRARRAASHRPEVEGRPQGAAGRRADGEQVGQGSRAGSAQVAFEPVGAAEEPGRRAVARLPEPDPVRDPDAGGRSPPHWARQGAPGHGPVLDRRLAHEDDVARRSRRSRGPDRPSTDAPRPRRRHGPPARGRRRSAGPSSPWAEVRENAAPRACERWSRSVSTSIAKDDRHMFLALSSIDASDGDSLCYAR